MISCILLTTHPRRAAYLADAVASYRAQTFAQRELVIINDGPTPLRTEASDIRVLNLPPRSDGRAWTIGEKRNVGLRHARGEFCATWDDDDISLPNRLRDQHDFAVATGADYVLADRASIADAEMRIYGTCYRGEIFPTMASALIRLSTAARSGGYSKKNYLEDAELLERVRMLKLGIVRVMPNADFYIARRHGGNVTNNFGEVDDDSRVCALKNPVHERMQAAVNRVRSIDTSRDIMEA